MAVERINRVLHLVLKCGMVMSLATMIFGLMLFTASGSGSDEVIPAEELIDSLASWDPLAIVQLGILMLIATPLVRIIAAFAVFSYERDRQFVMISLLVLSMVVMAMIVKL